MQLSVTSVNVIVDDVVAAATFMEALGAGLQPLADEWDAWAPHHRNLDVEASPGEVELDSPAFAAHWGGRVAGDPPVVVNLRVESRSAVDAVYARALGLGGERRREPFDAFWGARYALVRAPGPMLVGFMSYADDAHRGAAPEVASFA